MRTEHTAPALLRRLAELEATVGQLSRELGQLRSDVEVKALRPSRRPGVQHRGLAEHRSTRPGQDIEGEGGLAGAQARGEAARVRWVQEGRVVLGEQLAQAWGLTRQALAPAAKRGEIFSVKVGNRLYYAASFLNLDRQTVGSICRALGDLDSSEKLMFWLRGHGALAGKTVFEALDAGVPMVKVTRLAAAWAHSGEPHMSLRLPEPGSFEHLLRPVRIEVASLVRLSRRPATEPYWSRGVYRFDDTGTSGAGGFGTCYAASSIETAFAESVIHESGRFVDGSFEVPLADLTARSVVRFSGGTRKTLLLADLTGEALKALRLNNDISASDDYAISQAWAEAIHGSSTRWSGIRYVARQMNRGYAYALSERSGVSKLRAEKLNQRQLDELCNRFNVTAI